MSSSGPSDHGPSILNSSECGSRDPAPVAVLEAPGDTAWIVSAALAGRVWVDLTLERADAVRTRGRLDQPAILVDRGGVDRSLRPATREEVSDVFRAHLRPLV